MKSFPYTQNITSYDCSDHNWLVDQALQEDAPSGDISGAAFSQAGDKAQVRVIAKQSGVLCGIDLFTHVFTRAARQDNVSIELGKARTDKDFIQAGDEVCTITGPSRLLLRAERPALNFLGFLSGISTTVMKIIQTLRKLELEFYKVETIEKLPHKISILDTRKTLPGYRILSKYAVYCGGGQNHRLNLSEMAMIKENHIEAAGSIGAAVKLYAKHFNQPYEIEISNPSQVTEIISLSPKPIAVLLDNMDGPGLKKSCQILPNDILKEASGNFNESNLYKLMGSGVDGVSMGSITKTPDHFDFSVLLKRL